MSDEQQNQSHAVTNRGNQLNDRHEAYHRARGASEQAARQAASNAGKQGGGGKKR
jgi:hypothetical protein